MPTQVPVSSERPLSYSKNLLDNKPQSAIISPVKIIFCKILFYNYLHQIQHHLTGSLVFIFFSWVNEQFKKTNTYTKKPRELHNIITPFPLRSWHKHKEDKLHRKKKKEMAIMTVFYYFWWNSEVWIRWVSNAYRSRQPAFTEICKIAIFSAFWQYNFQMFWNVLLNVRGLD